ncbi:unnamed protein product, partial [Owenia fusiformis]
PTGKTSGHPTGNLPTCQTDVFRQSVNSVIIEKIHDFVRQGKICKSIHTSFCDKLMTYTGGSVFLTIDGVSKIATIMLNYPEKMNALSGKMMVDLHDIVSELEGWTEGKGVLMYGSNGSFCSGGDLETVSKIQDPELGGQMCKFMQEVTTRLHNLPLVSVALVQGKALGGGAELTTACDFRLMTESACIGFVQVKMGVSPGWGGTSRLVKLIGRKNALDLLTSGRLVHADEAKDLQLSDGTLPESDALLKAFDWLEQRTIGSVAAIHAVKSTVVVAENSDIEESLRHEQNVFKTVWGTQQEALMQ